MSQQDVDRLLREAHRHWFEDGLPEAALGVLFLAIGGFLLLRATLTVTGLLAGLVSLTLPLVILVYAVWMRNLVFTLKKRFTLPHRPHPRQPVGEWQRRWAMTISGAALAMFVVWGTASLAQAGGRSAGDWVPLLIALGIGVTYLYLGNRLLLARFYVLAALSGLWGALSSMAAEGALAAAVYFGLLGLSVLASGLYHLVAHLRGRRSR
ncbi:MAG: hypothetical protein GX649_19300 [Chloroflexi bacterium]|nr:hypothetical protein [Chloroflexota bacterium]